MRLRARALRLAVVSVIVAAPLTGSAVLGTGGIVLGRMREDEPQGRRLAQAATRLGAASIVLYLLLVVVDLLG